MVSLVTPPSSKFSCLSGFPPSSEVTSFDPIKYFNGFLKGLEPDCKYKPIDLLVWERGNLPDKDILFIPRTIGDPLAYIVVPVFNVYAGPFEVAFAINPESDTVDVAVSSLGNHVYEKGNDEDMTSIFDITLQIRGQNPEENKQIGLAILAAFNGYSRRLCEILGKEVFRKMLEKIRPTIVYLFGAHDTEIEPV